LTKYEANLENVSLLGDAEFLEDLRLQMHKFATLQLSDSQLAEDAVQDAFIGALKNAKSFAGRAALKTWVFAILKNKIADILRQKQRLAHVSSLSADDQEESAVAGLFDTNGRWHAAERPANWANPEGSMREGQFWHVFESCLDKLPGNLARVFMMREYIQLESDEICSTVGISVSNLNVIMYRARVRLRECLENHWFMKKEESC